MALWTQLDAALAVDAELTAKVEALTARVAELEAKLNEPPKTPDNSSLPPSHGTQGQQAASPQTAEGPPPRRGTRTASRPRPHRRGPGRDLSLPARRLWPRAVRTCRLSMSGSNCPPDQAHRHPGPPARRHLPPLRGGVHGAAAAGSGAGLALRPLDRGIGGLPAPLPGDRFRAAVRPVPGHLRPAHQRRGAGQPVQKGEAALRRTGDRHQRTGSGQPRRLLRRDLGPGGGAELVGVGLPRHRCRPPCHRAQPGEEGAEGDLRG